MKKRWFLVTISLLVGVSGICADLEALVRQAEQRLKAVTKIDAKITVGQGVATAARASGEIDISRKEVSELISAAKEDQRLSIVMFVLAHELAHVLQYREYVIAGKYTQPSWSQVFEAQADLLSGLWVGRVLHAPENFAGESAEIDPEAGLTAARLFFDIGSEPFPLGEHPSRQARRQAVRLGLAAALAQAGRSMAGSRIPEALREAYLSSAQAIVDSLPFKGAGGNQPFSLPWALRASEALVHCDPPAARFLEATFDFNESGFNSDPMNATAKHTVKFVNTGSKMLRVYWEPALVFKLRKDPEESLWWRRMPLAPEVREILLAPKETKTLRVNYNWNLNGNKYIGLERGREYMPAFIAPLEDEALWSVTFADETGPPRGMTKADIVVKYSSGHEATLPDALSSIYSTLLENSIEEKAKSPLYGMARDGEVSSRWFVLGIGFPGAEVRAYREDDGSYRVSVSRDFSKDALAASDFFREMVHTFELIPDLKLRQSSDKSARFESKDVSIRAEIRSHLKTDPVDMKRKDYYKVELWGYPTGR